MALELAPGLTLTIARHGQTQANVESRLQGQTVDSPLTSLGKEQARAVASTLRRAAGPGLAFVSSPLQRARATMDIIREAMELPPGGYRIDKRLIEIDFGDWDGLTLEEARERYPAAFAAREDDKWSVRDPSGRENYSDVAKRAESFVADLRANTFIVSHGVFTRVLRGLFEGLTWQQMSSLDEPQGVVFRARGSVVERLDD